MSEINEIKEKKAITSVFLTKENKEYVKLYMHYKFTKSVNEWLDDLRTRTDENKENVENKELL